MTAERPPRPFWLKLLLAVAVLVALCNAGVFLYGLTLPDEWRVERSVVIDAPPETVYPLLASPKRWPEWAEWSARNDATTTFTAEGPESGEGASLTWIGRELGTGQIKILKSEPDRSVTYELVLQGSEFTKSGSFVLTPADGGTRVTWADGGKIGNTLGRLFRERFEQSVAGRFDANLAELKAVAEAPNGSDGEPPTESSRH